MAKDAVDDPEEFSHAGDKRSFFGLTPGYQRLVETLHERVVAKGNETGHVEETAEI